MIALTLVWLGVLVVDPPSGDIRPARLQGLVEDRGQWVSPDLLVDREREDARLGSLRSEYTSRRTRTPGTSQGQRSLANWCDQVGLGSEAIAHHTAVIRLEPDDLAARKRLGYRRTPSDWKTDPEIEAESSESDARIRADRLWGPKIARWRIALTEPKDRDQATQGLTSIRDPRAVPAIRRSFGDQIPWEQAWAIKILSKIDAPESSRELARLSVFGIDESTRLSALRQLVRRDPRTFVGLLINWLHNPIRYQVVPQTEAVPSAVLRVEGDASIVERRYKVNNVAGFGVGSANAVESRAAVNSRQQADARKIDRSNVSIELTNLRVEQALQAVTGEDYGPVRQPWSAWWTNELGYSYQSPPPPSPKPVMSEEITVIAIARPLPLSAGTVQVHHSCFGAGTPVLSRTGSRPIEELRVGDQVLSQDPATGELAFQPILAIFHNKPTTTVRVRIGTETIVATPIHRFWRAGEGWVMARDLKTGDRVRSVGGVAEVVSVGRDAVQPVFNLEVAGGHSFFVGQSRALVHDNSLVGPTPEPFDAGIPVANRSGR